MIKNYTQVYVKNSFEAAEIYCKAFGAEITREYKNKDNTAYEHCELSVSGEGFLSLAEAKNPCYIEVVHKNKCNWWNLKCIFVDGKAGVAGRRLRPARKGGEQAQTKFVNANQGKAFPFIMEKI